MLTVDFGRFPVGPGDRVLDLGCGAGRHAFEALRRGATVVALDADAAELSGVAEMAAAMRQQGEAPPGAGTRTVCGDSNRACPLNTVQRSMERSQFSRPLREWDTTASLRALAARKSTATPPLMCTPNSAARRAWCATFALAMSVLVGVQPVLTQVPPNRWRSTMATVMPAPVSLEARVGPAWPAPIMMASNVAV